MSRSAANDTTTPSLPPVAGAGVAAGTTTASVLRILSGLHAGASRKLAAQEMILVGSGDDCDIVLADNGVARHHALVNIVGATASLRALDAPLRLDGAPLQPGDPVELRALQRVQIGDASIAFGGETDAGWATLLPMAMNSDGSVVAPKARSRRLPAIAALAVLSLASVAIFAAVMPDGVKQADPRIALSNLITEFHIRDGRTSQDVNGNPVLSGIVDTRATRDRIQERLQAEKIGATLDLRTGERIADDVREVLRTQGVTAKTRYLGDGDVQATGRFQDMDKLRTAAQSRAMHEVVGVNRVLVNNAVLDDDGTGAPRVANVPAPPPEPVRIVSVVRGDDPHVIALDGTIYAVGQELPGRGNLASIGQTVQVLAADGSLHKLKAEPVTPAELAAAAQQKLADEAVAAGIGPETGDGTKSASSIKPATESARATVSTAVRPPLAPAAKTTAAAEGNNPLRDIAAVPSTKTQ